MTHIKSHIQFCPLHYKKDTEMEPGQKRATEKVRGPKHSHKRSGWGRAGIV